jgi:polyhydroxyalkanoate synthesis regulator phasin
MASEVQNYMNLVLGLSKTTRAKARATAKALLAQAGLEEVANDAGERVTKLADEIIAASRANRELFENLVATEVERVATRLGFARTDELNMLRQELADLRLTLIRVDARTATPAPATEPPPTVPPPTEPPPTVPLSTDAPAAVATPSSPTSSAAPTKKAPAKRSPAKRPATKTASAPPDRSGSDT